MQAAQAAEAEQKAAARGGAGAGAGASAAAAAAAARHEAEDDDDDEEEEEETEQQLGEEESKGGRVTAADLGLQLEDILGPQSATVAPLMRAAGFTDLDFIISLSEQELFAMTVRARRPPRAPC